MPSPNKDKTTNLETSTDAVAKPITILETAQAIKTPMKPQAIKTPIKTPMKNHRRWNVGRFLERQSCGIEGWRFVF